MLSKEKANQWIYLLATLITLFFAAGFLLLPRPDIQIGWVAASIFTVGMALLLLMISLLLIKIRAALMAAVRRQAEGEKNILSMQAELEKQNKMIRQLSRLYNEAIDYDRVKTEFFSNISHDLKTPLSVILGAIQLIDQSIPQHTDRRRSGKHLKTVRQNCYRLIRLVNNILDLTKMDSGFMKSSFTNCNLIYLVEEITLSVVPFAQQKGILLEFDTDSEEVVTGVDMEKFERIILNLLSNAIKFTPAGGKVSVQMSARNDKVFISVKDTGLGIPSAMQPLIFERFKQVNSTLTKDFEGTGIGLSLVKSFVELHQGSIQLVSEVGKGSEFTLEIPICPVDIPADEAVCQESRQNKMAEAIHIEFSDIYSADYRKEAAGSGG